MNISELLPDEALDAIATQLGIPRDQAKQGAEALLPSVLGGMGDATCEQAIPGATDLEEHINSLGGGDMADSVLSPGPTNPGKGNSILNTIFGSKDISREVAAHAALNTGLDPALLTKMLPIVAMLVAGYMSKRAGGQQGGLGGIVGSVLGSLVAGGTLSNQPSASAGGLGGGLGGILGSILGRR